MGEAASVTSPGMRSSVTFTGVDSISGSRDFLRRPWSPACFCCHCGILL